MGDNECSHEGCEFDVYEDKNECVLHCKKHIRGNRKEYNFNENEKILNEFYSTLLKYLPEEKKEIIFFEEIIFPSLRINANAEIKHSRDYTTLLQPYERKKFYKCLFYINEIKINLELDRNQNHFDNCIFYHEWLLYNYQLLNKKKVLYKNCEFKEIVRSNHPQFPKEKTIFTTTQFEDCKFQKKEHSHKEFSILLKDTIFEKNIFNNTDNFSSNIEKILLSKCELLNEFNLSNYSIGVLVMKDSIFKSKLKNNSSDKIVNFKIVNSRFEDVFDCSGREFTIFDIKQSTFDKVVDFKGCKFINSISKFEDVHFLDMINFRGAKFYKGLDLQDTLFKEYPNFLDIYLEPKNTNKETFRIIKHSFDKVGNTIEANKYFADEMKKEREDSSSKNFFYKLMLDFNYLVSDFGQSWIRPFFLIIYFLILQYLVFCLMDNWKISNELLRTIWIGVNHTIHDFMPFKKFLVEGKEFVSLFFLIIYSTLIYNLIIAVKRITKR